MKIAIVGSSGYIAGYIVKRLYEQMSVEHVLLIDKDSKADEKLDLAKPEQFNFELLKGIDFLIFTAAISGPDECAIRFNECWKINVIGTKYFIKEAIKRNCKVLFFSSDAVYGNMQDIIYNECSETRAATPYGKMKKAIEDEFKGSSLFKVIRLSYVVSSKDKFVRYCLDCMREDKIASVFHPFYRNCVVITDVINAVWWLIVHWEKYDPCFLNLAGKELVSRIRIADEINRCFGGKLQYHVVQPETGFFMNRPQITQMESLYLTQYHILEDTLFSEKIRRELENIVL